jgi:heptosyltransferase-3
MKLQLQRILIYQLGSIGDTVVTIPALRAIRRHFGPVAYICLLHETHSSIINTPHALLAGSREVDSFLKYPVVSSIKQKILIFIRLWWRLRCERFDSVLYLMPSERTLKQVKRDAFFFSLCGIEKRIGFRAFSKKLLYPVEADGHPALVKHEALCRLERLQLDGIDISFELDLTKPFLSLKHNEFTVASKWLRQNRKHPDRKLIAICPGTKQTANQWPEDRFIEIGRRLLSQGKYELVVVGGPAEAEVGNRIIAAWGSGLYATGVFSVLESAALLGMCSLCIGLDTGTTHLAAALGTKCVALYGERDNPGRFEPLGKGHTVLRTKVSCAGCRLKSCPLPQHPCMMGIEVDTVWEAIIAILRME